MKPDDKDQYSEKEAARRRDAVIRRMANTPPQPRVKPSAPHSKKGTPTGPGRAVRKRTAKDA